MGLSPAVKWDLRRLYGMNVWKNSTRLGIEGVWVALSVNHGREGADSILQPTGLIAQASAA